jgi:hypothetical protein
MKAPVVLVVIAALIAAPAFPEKVTLKSGDTYTGEIIEETEEYIRLKSGSKILKIRRTAIAEITSPEVEVEVETEEEKASNLIEARERGREEAESEVN